MPVDIPKYCDKMTHSLQKLGRRGIFQHDHEPKHTAEMTQDFLKKKKSENYDLAKYVAWLESSGTPFGYFKLWPGQVCCLTWIQWNTFGVF